MRLAKPFNENTKSQDKAIELAFNKVFKIFLNGVKECHILSNENCWQFSEKYDDHRGWIHQWSVYIIEYDLGEVVCYS